MKKWYYWLIFGAIWIVCAIMNYFDGREITANVIQIAVFIFLAFCQLFCYKRGEKGRRIFKKICIGVIIVLVVYLFVIILT